MPRAYAKQFTLYEQVVGLPRVRQFSYFLLGASGAALLLKIIIAVSYSGLGASHEQLPRTDTDFQLVMNERAMAAKKLKQLEDSR